MTQMPEKWGALGRSLRGIRQGAFARATNVALNRSNYKAVWNSVSQTEEHAKTAVSGSADEQSYKDSGEYTKNVLLKFLSITKDDVVLEIGAGVGRVAAFLAPICREWIGVDVSENMLRHAERRLSRFNNIRTIASNGFDLSNVASESVEVVYSTVVYMHLDEWERFSYVKEGFRVLKPGGRMFVDNIDLTSDLGWQFFESVSRIPPSERPPNISKTSTPEELRTYFSRAGFVDLVQHWEDLWVFTIGKKP